MSVRRESEESGAATDTSAALSKYGQWQVSEYPPLFPESVYSAHTVLQMTSAPSLSC